MVIQAQAYPVAAWRCTILVVVLLLLGCHSVTVDLAVVLLTWHASNLAMTKPPSMVQLEIEGECVYIETITSELLDRADS